jgi:pentatricopeptide repeat protein
VDVERFESLCEMANAEKDVDAKRAHYRAALDLYAGEFLGKFSSESWVEPVAAYYYNIYIEVVQKFLSLLPVEEYAQEIVDRSSVALRTSPYQESLYQYMMRGLMALQEFEKAAEIYEEMRELLFTHLGVFPDEKSQEIHAEIRCHICAPYLTLDVIRDDLREKNPPSGAFFCDYSVFKLFYRVEARSASRRGDAIHVGILSISGANGKKLTKNGLERAMEQLREKIRCGVRRGDIVARCSASQFAIMLLQANYENSNMVCTRIAHSFAQAYPHSSVRIQCSVLPLEPLPGYAPQR